MGDNSMDIEVIQITDPWHFMACEKPELSRSSASQEFQLMHEDMNQYCSKMIGTEFYRPNVGDVCGALSRDDGLWHRVRIERIISQPHGQQACCLLVDKGSQLRESTLRKEMATSLAISAKKAMYRIFTGLKQMMRLPKKFQEFPYQVHQCCLWGVQPITLKIIETETGLSVKSRPCRKWDLAATEYMQKMIDESQGCQAEVVCRDSENTLFLQLHLLTRRGLLCLNEALVDGNYALKVYDTDFDLTHERLIVVDDTLNNSDTLSSSPPGDTKDTLLPAIHDMPPLISPQANCLQQKSLPRMSENTDSLCCVSNELAYTHKQEQPQRQQHPSIDNYRPPSQADSSMYISNTPGIAHQGLPSPESKFCSKSSTLLDQPSLMHNRNNNSDAGQMAPISTSLSSQLVKLSLKDSPPAAETTSNICFGRGRDASLVKDMSVVAQSDRNSSHTDENHPFFGSSHSTSLRNSNVSSSFVPQDTHSSFLPSHLARIETSLLASRVDNSSLNSPRSPPYSDCSVTSPVDTNSSLTSTGSGAGTSYTNPSNRSLENRSGQSKDSRLKTLQHADTCKTPPVSTSKNVKMDLSLAGDRRSDKSTHGTARGASVIPSMATMTQNNLKNENVLSRFQEKIFNEPHRQDHGSNHPLIVRQDRPETRPILGVVIHGKSIPSLVCDVDDVHFKDNIKEAFKKQNIDTARSIQAWVWPAALSCRHIVGICPPKQGKTMSYVPVVVSLLLDYISYSELPPGMGPIALVIVPTWKKGRNVLEMVNDFTMSNSKSRRRIRSNVLYAGGVEENDNVKMTLMQGCDILIATPQSLLRMLHQSVTSLKRLCHIILDDAEILASVFATEVDTIMQMYKLHLKDYRDQNKCLSVPRQIMIFATQWSTALEEFYFKYTVEPIIAISSRVEASVYGGVRQIVTMTKWEHRLNTFCGLLSALATSTHRVAAFAQDVEEAVLMHQAAKSIGVYCLLIHETLLLDTISETRDQWIHSSNSKHLMVMVCTDDCYQDLAISNATMVVHYGLPDSKTKFGNRLACMVDYFLDRTVSVKSDVEPVSQVILTNKCAAKAQSLYEILQRCPAEFSPQLEKFLQGYKMGVERDPRKSLCPFLKSFGVCSNQDRCCHRHLIIPEQDFRSGEVSQNTLPSSGEVKITVIQVKNASCFYCHLVYHRSVPDQVRTDLRLEYQRLVMEMVSFFSKESNHVPFVPSSDPSQDDICAFKDSSNIFFRAKVVDVRKSSVHTPMECKLWLVDAGYHQVVTIDQLVRLPERLAQVPYQAVEVHLCCVKPMDNDNEWTCEADTFMSDLIKGKELVGRIMLRVGMTLWLLPLVHQVTLKNVGVTSDMNIRQELLGNKLGTPNPEHIQRLYEFFRGHIEIPEKLMRQYFNYALETDIYQETLADEETYYEVMIAAVINPGLLYLQKWENFDLLEKLEAQIAGMMCHTEEKEETEKRKADADIKLERGSVCLALSSDGRWYRAKIVSDLLSGKWGVFFLDYGDRENISEHDLQPLPRELAELPCQAIECELAHIQQHDASKRHQAVDVLCDLAHFVNEDKKHLLAQVVKRADPHYGVGQKLVINLYDDYINFSEQLVWRHLAECAEGSDETDTIKAFSTVDYLFSPLVCTHNGKHEFLWRQRKSGFMYLMEKPAIPDQGFINAWEKIPNLCASIYWSEAPPNTIQQAHELQDILSTRGESWESNLLQGNALASVFKLVGYVPDIEAHAIVLDCLVSCFLDSDSLTELAVSENVASRLASCLEQVSRPRVQHQAAQAVARLVSSKRFCESLSSSDSLVTVLVQFLSQQQISQVELETLKCVCSASAQLVQTDESVFTEFKSAEMVEKIFASLQQTSSDPDREPWLKLLAAIATWESSHKCLMREAHVAALLNLLLQCSCCKCQYYLLSVFQSIVQNSRRHKLVLLENRLLIILNDLEAGGLRSPALEVCKHLQEEMALTIPQAESLAGLPARHVTEVDKIVSPQVTWSQNCSRLVLNVKIREARLEDFVISESRIYCRCTSDGVRYELDWQLYDSIQPAKSKVAVYASHSLVSLWKKNKGVWSRPLREKIKLPNFKGDFDHPYDSADEDVEDDENLTVLTRKKDIFNQEEMWKTQRVNAYQSSEESSDELAYYSRSSDDEPVVDAESLMVNKM